VADGDHARTAVHHRRRHRRPVHQQARHRCDRRHAAHQRGRHQQHHAGSVDGTLTFHLGDDGSASSVEYHGDGYPSIGAYQYRDDGTTDVLLQHDSEPFTHALPWWPDGLRIPDPGQIARYLPDLEDLIVPGFPLPGVPFPGFPLPVDLPGPFEWPIDSPFNLPFPGIPWPPLISGPWNLLDQGALDPTNLFDVSAAVGGGMVDAGGALVDAGSTIAGNVFDGDLNPFG
jgi:hypothetical protein